MLLKAIIQVIPTYAMSMFALSKKICKEITSSMSKFWWGHMTKDSRVYWKKWEMLGGVKSQGGLGFWDLTAFNKALLAKRVWRLCQEPQTLTGLIMNAKYFSSTNIMHAKVGYNLSLIWLNINEAIDLVKEWMFWKIGNGNTTHI